MTGQTFFLILTFWILAPLVSAVEIRVATYNVLTGIGNVGDPGRAELESVISRINPDVLALQEVTGNDLNGPLDGLTSNLGYPFVFIPVTALDTRSRVVILSKFPFVANSSESIVSPPGANDMTRAAAAVIVNVPGTDNDPTIVTAHLKCCFETDDPFRRAVEMMRIRKYLEGHGLDKNDNVFVLGDFNLLGNNLVFSSLPTGLPPSYSLGNDVSFDVNYYVDPTDYFTGLGLVNPGYRQQDGITTDTFRGSSTILDYLLVSNSVASRVPGTEIYNSEFDTLSSGLPKTGSPLPNETSEFASDHYPIFGDFELDGGQELDLSLTEQIIDEDGPASLITVTLAQPASDTVQVSLQSSDPTEATVTDAILTIPVNGTQASTTLQPQKDKITDGDNLVEITASAAGFNGSMASVTIRDSDPTFYAFSDTISPIVEEFTGFAGNQSLAAWSDNNLTWVGKDDGSSRLNGARSYQGSLGIFTAQEATFETSFRNLSGHFIPAVQIDFDAQLWRRFANVSADKLMVSIIKDGNQVPIPELGFEPGTTGTPGQLSPPETQSKSAYLRNLNLAAGEEFKFRVDVIPGALGEPITSDIFINEFHYDNGGQDTGEFIEVVVGQAFSGDLASIIIHLYNGNNRRIYGSSFSLDTFTPGPSNTPGSPAYYFREIAGIQNGGPDGIALEIDGVVREFISYEGTFTALDGIAAGITSTSVRVSQGPGTPTGQQSIARTGTGGVGEDFTWAIQPGNHTPGEVNVGQNFGESPQPQGIAIDNLVMTPLADSDGDGIPDREELELGTNPALADSDRDGQNDFFETFLAGTDPLSGASTFKPNLILDQDMIKVDFPSLEGRFYKVETSIDLEKWLPQPGLAGTGNPLSFSFLPQNEQFFRVRISLLP